MIEDVLNQLGIANTGSYNSQGDYVIDISNSASFGRMYSKLDNSSVLEPVDDNTMLTVDTGNLQYIYRNKLLLSLVADWASDTYKLVIKEL